MDSPTLTPGPIMLIIRSLSNAIVLLLASLISQNLWAQAASEVKAPRSIKRARAQHLAPQPLPDCKLVAGDDVTRYTRRAKLHRDLPEIVVVSCPLYDAAYPDSSYLLDIRYSSGESLQKLVVQSPLSVERFGADLLDVTGDGYVDLIVNTAEAGGGPYVEVDLYLYNPESKAFQRDSSFLGTSVPTLARTKGCVVTEFRAGPGSYSATRSCLDSASRQWQPVESCSIAPDEGCSTRLAR